MSVQQPDLSEGLEATLTQFDGQKLFQEYEDGVFRDEAELEEILTDFEQLCIEFQVWANARVQWTTSKDANELVEQWQEVQGIEEAQNVERTRLKSFVDNIKQAFNALFDRT